MYLKTRVRLMISSHSWFISVKSICKFLSLFKYRLRVWKDSPNEPPTRDSFTPLFGSLSLSIPSVTDVVRSRPEYQESTPTCNFN